MMKKESEANSCRLERKTVEKNRRLQMKSLCFKLATLLPHTSMIPKDAQTQLDHLDQAASYITTLQKRVDELQCKKKMSLRSRGDTDNCTSNGGCSVWDMKIPVVEIRDMDSTLEVILICGSVPKNRSLFYEAITVLEEEGADVVNASFSTVGSKIFCTIHSQVTLARIGLEASRVTDRLTELIHL